MTNEGRFDAARAFANRRERERREIGLLRTRRLEISAACLIHRSLLTSFTVTFLRFRADRNRRVMLVTRAGTAAISFASRHNSKHSSLSRFSSEHRNNSPRRLNLPNSNPSRHNSNSRECRQQHSLNTLQISSRDSAHSSSLQIRQATAVATSSHLSACRRTATHLDRRTSTVAQRFAHPRARKRRVVASKHNCPSAKRATRSLNRHPLGSL